MSPCRLQKSGAAPRPVLSSYLMPVVHGLQLVQRAPVVSSCGVQLVEHSPQSTRVRDPLDDATILCQRRHHEPAQHARIVRILVSGILRQPTSFESRLAAISSDDMQSNALSHPTAGLW